MKNLFLVVLCLACTSLFATEFDIRNYNIIVNPDHPSLNMMEDGYHSPLQQELVEEAHDMINVYINFFAPNIDKCSSPAQQKYVLERVLDLNEFIFYILKERYAHHVTSTHFKLFFHPLERGLTINRPQGDLRDHFITEENEQYLTYIDYNTAMKSLLNRTSWHARDRVEVEIDETTNHLKKVVDIRQLQQNLNNLQSVYNRLRDSDNQERFYVGMEIVDDVKRELDLKINNSCN